MFFYYLIQALRGVFGVVNTLNTLNTVFNSIRGQLKKRNFTYDSGTALMLSFKDLCFGGCHPV